VETLQHGRFLACAQLVEIVVQRQEDHALVMRHVLAHDCVVTAERQAAGREIQRLIEPVDAEAAQPRQVCHVVHDLGRAERQGQQRSVRCDDGVLGQVALVAQPGHAERAIPVVVVAVQRVEARLGDAPGLSPAPAVGNLVIHGGGRALVQQGPGIGAHEQRGHQVLEHGGAPGQQRTGAVDLGERPGQVHPMAAGHLALGEGHQAGDAGLGCEQVVIVLVQLARGHVVADVKDLALAVEQEGKVHLPEVLFGLRLDVGEASQEFLAHRPGCREFLTQRVTPAMYVGHLVRIVPVRRQLGHCIEEPVDCRLHRSNGCRILRERGDALEALRQFVIRGPQRVRQFRRLEQGRPLPQPGETRQEQVNRTVEGGYLVLDASDRDAQRAQGRRADDRRVLRNELREQGFQTLPTLAGNVVECRAPLRRLGFGVQHAVAQFAEQRPQVAGAGDILRGCEVSQEIIEQAESVCHALPAGPPQHRCRAHLLAGTAEDPQAGGQVAAVHSRYVSRRQRSEAARVIPVQEVAAKAFQPREALEGRAQPGNEVDGPNIAQVVRGERGEQEQADIGGRCIGRDFAERRFLVVVRGQPVVLRSDEILEKQPGAPGQAVQRGALGCGERCMFAPDGLADAKGDLGGDGPQEQQEQGCGQAAGPQQH